MSREVKQLPCNCPNCGGVLRPYTEEDEIKDNAEFDPETADEDLSDLFICTVCDHFFVNLKWQQLLH